MNITCKVSKYFSLINHSSFNYSRIKEQKEAFSPILTPPIIINQEAVFAKSNFSVALSARYQHGSYIDFANEETLKDYFLLNTRGSISINKLRFSLFLNNMTNSRYFNQGYLDFDGSRKYFVQAPVNLYASIQFDF
jgi:iron complex outermembrane receptor protein